MIACKFPIVLAVAAAFVCPLADANADSFGSGANSFDIPFVSIGDPGNAPDNTGTPNPAGSVAYEYRIATFEVSEGMIEIANSEGGLGITKRNLGQHQPAIGISWLEAARFVNWLNSETNHGPAYKFAGGNFELWTPGDPGFDPANRFRNSNAKYFLPSADEWYKAAYYDPATDGYFDFATGSDNVPIPVTSGTSAGTAIFDHSYSQGPANITVAGGLSRYGTMAQSGNVWEWEETELDLVNDSPSALRGKRGGSWASNLNSGHLSSSMRYDGLPESELIDSLTGFRVASEAIPEPSAILLTVAGGFALLRWRR